MPGISDRLTAVETNTKNILDLLKEIKEDRKDHLEKCHSEMEKHWNAIQENTHFKNIVIKIFWWMIPSSGVVLLVIYFGVKELLKKGVI